MTREMMIEGLEVLVTNRFEEAPYLVTFTITGEESDRLLYSKEDFIRDVEEEIKRREYGFTEILKITWYGISNGKLYKEIKYEI